MIGDTLIIMLYLKEMIRINNNLKKNLDINGFVVIKDFFSNTQKSQLKIFSDNYSKNFILDWSKQNKYFHFKSILKEKNLRNKIIKYYNIFNKPKYRRNPQKTLATEDFLEILENKNFKKIQKLCNSNKWYFSFIKNLRFKSKVLPWSISKWHCDRLIYKNFKDSKMKFFVCWFPIQNVNNKTGGGLELIYKNSFSFDKIENKLFKNFNKDIFFLNDHINRLKKKTYKTNLKFGDLLIFDSSIFHRTIKTTMLKPIWSMDIRFEHGEVIDTLSKYGGFDMKNNKNLKLKKLKKSANLKII